MCPKCGTRNGLRPSLDGDRSCWCCGWVEYHDLAESLKLAGSPGMRQEPTSKRQAWTVDLKQRRDYRRGLRRAYVLSRQGAGAEEDDRHDD